MTSAQSGMNGTLWVCATVNGTYVKLGELSDLKLKIDGKEIDTSNVDDAGWGSAITGARSWDISSTANLILADAGYILLIAALIASSVLYVKILTSGTATSSPVGWMGSTHVNSGNLTIAGPSTQQKGDWTLKGSGALTTAT